jgi:hypothetical protein
MPWIPLEALAYVTHTSRYTFHLESNDLMCIGILFSYRQIERIWIIYVLLRMLVR